MTHTCVYVRKLIKNCIVCVLLQCIFKTFDDNIKKKNNTLLMNVRCDRIFITIQLCHKCVMSLKNFNKYNNEFNYWSIVTQNGDL